MGVRMVGIDAQRRLEMRARRRGEARRAREQEVGEIDVAVGAVRMLTRRLLEDGARAASR